MESNESTKTLWCGNLSGEVTEDLLYELFLQAGPLKNVCIPKNPRGIGNRNYGFVMFKHTISAQYAIDLLQGVTLFNQLLHIRKRAENQIKSVGIECGFPQFRQNDAPRMVPTMQMGAIRLQQSLPISSSHLCDELILLDVDNSSLSTSLKFPQNYCSNKFSNSSRPATFSLSQKELLRPMPQRMEMQGFHIQPFSLPSDSPMLSPLQNPWKQLETRPIVDKDYSSEPENERQRRLLKEPHHVQHHQPPHLNNLSPYGQQHRHF